jgi:hypothetical protein
MSWKDIFYEKGSHLFWRRIPDDHVVGMASGQTIDADQAYFVLRLTEMYLGHSRTLWRKSYPLVHGFTGYNGAEEHSVAGPAQLQELGGRNLDKVIVVNSRLAGPIPFTGGEVSLLVGLWSVPGDDAAKALVTTVGALSGLLGGVGTPVTQVVNIVKSSVESVLSLDKTTLRLAVGDTFFSDNPLRAGFHVGIATPAPSVEIERLWLRDGTLVTGADPMVARPYDEHDYFVIQVERREIRDDWPALPGIRELNEQFGAVMGTSEPVAHKRDRLAKLWPGFIQALAASTEITDAHAKKLQADVAQDLTARLDALERGNPFETKAWGSDQVETGQANTFDFADVPDYVTIGQITEPPSFLG